MNKNSKENKDVQEKNALIKFREVTSDLQKDDKTLLRFLRARSFDINKAEDQLRKAIKWRKEFEIDALPQWNAPSEIKDDMVTYFTGFDLENRPVYYSKIGEWDIRPVLAKGMKDDCLRYSAKSMELVLNVEDAVNSSQFIPILDCAGATFAKAVHWGTIEFMIRIFHDFEAYYPETLHSAYVVNVPSIFWYAYNLIKPLFSSHTLSKIHIFDSDTKRWQSALLEDIPAKALSVECGGTVTKGIPVLDHKEFLETYEFDETLFAPVLANELSSLA